MCELRAELQWFAQRMEEQLKKNDHKGGWQGRDPWVLVLKLFEELGEVAILLPGGKFVRDSEAIDEIVGELADASNTLMMIADNIALSEWNHYFHPLEAVRPEEGIQEDPQRSLLSQGG